MSLLSLLRKIIIIFWLQLLNNYAYVLAKS